MALTQDIFDILFGDPWGRRTPPRPNPPFPAVDGRTTALRVLRQYITALDFFREMGPNRPAEKFNIPPSSFFIEWPDSIQTMPFPSIAVVHSRANYDVIGLVGYIEEDTIDVYQPGTVLQWQAEYRENIQLEIWTETKSERRAILSGLETALSPTEQMSGLRFRMKDYFNELVCFTLNDRQVIDEPDSARNRRRAQVGIEMRFNVVALVNTVTLNPVVKTNVDVDEDTGEEVDLTTDVNAVVVDNS